MAGLVHPQVTRRLNLARIPAEIAEGLAFARTKPTILLVFGITIVTNAFAFAYSGLVAPLGIVGVRRLARPGRRPGRRPSRSARFWAAH